MVDAFLRIMQDPGVTALAGVLAGGLIGWLSAWYVGVQLARRREFNHAAAAFRDAFAFEIHILEEGQRAQFIDGFFREHGDAHGQAYVKFRREFVGRKRRKLDAAWRDFTDVAYGPKEGKETETVRQQSLAVLQALLKFADPR